MKASFHQDFLGYLPGRRTVARLFHVAAAAVLISAVVIWNDWQRDSIALEQRAAKIVAGLAKPSERIAALNHWVYSNQGFAKNQEYYLLKRLGPTPSQVMRHGGDCSDKSRLLSAMLARLGIRSSLVMISDCAECPAIHTVVEVEHEAGRMVVDPVWDVVYSGARGEYFSVRELANTPRAWQRVTALKTERGPGSKIAQMDESQANFDHAVKINWERNRLTRAFGASLHMAGLDPNSIHRPGIFEDPQLLLADVCLMLSFGLFLLGFAMGWRPKGKLVAKLSLR